jgi:hypothetical protein
MTRHCWFQIKFKLLTDVLVTYHNTQMLHVKFQLSISYQHNKIFHTIIIIVLYIKTLS